MEITGRITADATLTKVDGERMVVNFSIAINDSYRPKGSSEFKEITTYVNCAYWLNAKTAQWLQKGALVQLGGRIGMDAYINGQGDAVGRLTFHVNSLKILAFAKKKVEDIPVTAHEAVLVQGNNAKEDDLPF